MKTGSNNHKRVIMAAAIFLAMSAIAVGAGIFLHAVTGDEEICYREAMAEYGLLQMGITKDGTVSVECVEQAFDLDISGYIAEDAGFSFAGLAVASPGAAMAGNDGDTGSSRLLEVEEVYVMQGQEIKKGDPLFGLTKESVEEIREELEADEEEAKLQLDQKSLLREKAVTEAAQVYEQNQIYGEGASLEYEDSLYDLQKALEEAQKAVEEALEELEEYGTDVAAHFF